MGSRLVCLSVDCVKDGAFVLFVVPLDGSEWHKF